MVIVLIMKATIEINDLRVYSHHGVSPQECECGNEYSVTLHVVYPARAAAESDDLGGTVDYSEVVELIKFEMNQPAQLLEHVAWRIREAVIKRWPKIEAGRVRVAKLSPPMTAELASAAVTLEW